MLKDAWELTEILFPAAMCAAMQTVEDQAVHFDFDVLMSDLFNV